MGLTKPIAVLPWLRKLGSSTRPDAGTPGATRWSGTAHGVTRATSGAPIRRSLKPWAAGLGAEQPRKMGGRGRDELGRLLRGDLSMVELLQAVFGVFRAVDIQHIDIQVLLN